EFWKPGWKVTERAEWRAKRAKLAERDARIMDGNYGVSLDLRLPRADTVMWFDYPRLGCLWRAHRGGGPTHTASRRRPWAPGPPRDVMAISCASSGLLMPPADPKSWLCWPSMAGI